MSIIIILASISRTITLSSVLKNYSLTTMNLNFDDKYVLSLLCWILQQTIRPLCILSDEYIKDNYPSLRYNLVVLKHLNNDTVQLCNFS